MRFRNLEVKLCWSFLTVFNVTDQEGNKVKDDDKIQIEEVSCFKI